MDTSPSLTPNTAARAEPPVTERWPWMVDRVAHAPWPRSADGSTAPRGWRRYSRASDEDPTTASGTEVGDTVQTCRTAPGRVAEALGRLCEIAALRQPDDPLLVRFLPLYYSELPEGDVDDRKLDDVYAVAVAHLALGRVRGAGRGRGARAVARRERDGWQSPHSVLLVVTDDMPFLVDTMRMVLERRASASTCSSTRCCAVARDDADRLVDVPPRHGRARAPVEAWTQIEIDRTDDATAAELEAEIRAAVEDVRRVVADFAPCATGWRRSPTSTRSCRGSPPGSSCSSARPSTTSAPTAR